MQKKKDKNNKLWIDRGATSKPAFLIKDYNCHSHKFLFLSQQYNLMFDALSSVTGKPKTND